MLSTLDREIRRAYDQLAPRYDYKFADYLRATHDVALRLAEPKEGEDILDASAGTGLLAERILPLVGNGRLVLLDLSSGMLQRSKQRIERYPQVACIAADVHRLPFSAAQFSTVLSVNAFHHYEDPEQAVVEFYRVLRPSGKLVIVDWCRDPMYFKFFDALMQKLDPAYHHSYTVQDVQGQLAAMGFSTDSARRWRHHLFSLMGIRARKEAA